MTRWISGVILAVLVVLLLLKVPGPGIQTIVVILSMLGLREFLTLTIPDDTFVTRLLGIIVGGIVTASLVFWAKTPDHFLTIFAGTLITTFLLHFTGHPDFEVRIRRMVFFYFGIMYTSLLFSYWGWMRQLPYWQFWLFLMLGCTFMSDVGGYVMGKRFGTRKLAPYLSPGKSIEGYIGGVCFAVVGGFVVRILFRPDFPIWQLIIVAVAVGAIAPLGDLSESLIKRGVKAKDSGNLIPGHGGLLDRVDALLFSGPVVYYFAKWFS